MAITYRQSKFDAPHKVPVLHKVVYSVKDNFRIGTVEYLRQSNEVDEWLKEHCQRRYYRSPGYRHETFIEFECDEDAALFALKWA